MTHSKPCARGGCTGTIVEDSPSHLDRRLFCSHRCHILERRRRGWKPHALTAADRRKGGVAGGLASGKRRGREAAIRRGELIARFITSDMRARLTAEEMARLKGMLSRAVRYGMKLGYHAAWSRRRYQPVSN